MRRRSRGDARRHRAARRRPAIASTRCSRSSSSSITRCRSTTSAAPTRSSSTPSSSSRATASATRSCAGVRAFHNFRVVPPDTGIVHQVNIEYLARVVFRRPSNGVDEAYPDTLVGTDSHTTMVNGLGVVGWGVGGIEAEAAMLGQPISMLIPQVLGFRLTGAMPEGATATDLVLTITEILRKHGVVGKFVEFFGRASKRLTIADRATLGNMCPEYGATIAIFPIDEMTLDYLRPDRPRRVAGGARRGLREGAGAVPHRPSDPDAAYSETIELDLSTSSRASPDRSGRRIACR